MRRHRHLPELGEREPGHVSLVHGHPGGGALDPRPGPAAVRDAAGNHDHRRLAVHGGPGRARPLSLVQGLQVRLPVGVDMATYKAEFLAHHYEHRLRPRAHYSMGWLPVWARVAGLAPRAVNALTRRPAVAALLKRAGGIAPERDIPRFDPHPFVRSWTSRPPGSRPSTPATRGPVLLWPDTFTNAFHPDVARSAVRVLEDAGFEVRVPTRRCAAGSPGCPPASCDVATKVLRRTLDVLREDLRAGDPGRRAGAVVHGGLPVRRPRPPARRRGHAPALAADPDPRRAAHREGPGLDAAAARRRRRRPDPLPPARGHGHRPPTTP